MEVRSTLPRAKPCSIATLVVGFTVVGLYLSVVLVVGRFLRTAFQNSTFRLVVEEIPNPQILLDMCMAINLSRIYADLKTEYRIYSALIKFLRSPVTLLKLGGPDLELYGLYRRDPDPALKQEDENRAG